ncbi:uncharacterized protein EI97DRAFT_498506 [Westerdykella ornata]|uniref:F-box domain-containing protein n=1 Tax=Westerdykella ornata TaxID=318751 RepID=A0A6A6JZ17_WESOR|nr:uncharacterized protein EI97DRAFT_498506 [Westerdykella ornata]KAF2280289.1 hypothetical protein EI97DRAFT_498506 [Westerdykella ornata]
MGPLVTGEGLPSTTLADLLSNTLVLRQTAPYLPVASLYALAATSKSLRHIVYTAPESFRHLDLSTVKSAFVKYVPLDSGGISWRSERMDESLTEDEFYSGPLRGIFSKLQRRHLLHHVHTLVLDGLSVPADLVQDIISEDRFNVRILSLREAQNLNERKLMQVLRYAVRPSRPAGTPKIKGIYLFGPRERAPVEDPWSRKNSSGTASTGVTRRRGAQIGAQWNHKSSDALNTALARTEDRWYQCSGRMLPRKPSLEWAETLQACDGIIAFDAVLCRGPRHNPENATSGNGAGRTDFYLRPAIATVALGPSGCDTCHSSPEGPAQFGHSSVSELPLLSPIPLHASTIRAAQMPHTIDGSRPPPLFVRCEDCLKGRWCERCHKWWDEKCYTPSTVAQRTELQQTEFIETVQSTGGIEVVTKNIIKVGDWGVCEKPADTSDFQTIGVRRDCFGCGHTCISCKEIFIRRCEKCGNEYCHEDNDASSLTRCDWCNYTSRRTVEMY